MLMECGGSGGGSEYTALQTISGATFGDLKGFYGILSNLSVEDFYKTIIIYNNYLLKPVFSSGSTMQYSNSRGFSTTGFMTDGVLLASSSSCTYYRYTFSATDMTIQDITSTAYPLDATLYILS